MRKLTMSLTLLGLLTTVAAAQPTGAPPAPPEAPAPPPTPAEPLPPAPPAPPTPPPAVVVVAPTAEPAQPDKPKDPEPPKKLAIASSGLWQPGALLQGWFLVDASGGDITTSTFRLRRAELSVKGEILPKRVGYQVMIDPAKVREFGTSTLTTMAGDTVAVKQPVGAVSVLQDFYITFLHEHIDVSVGQFKIPVSWEGYNSSSKIIMPERAMSSSLFGDKRDLGIRLAKTFKKWGYSGGIFNGAGLNNLDTNNQKDVALRLEAYPVKGLTLAAVAYDSVGYRRRAGTKDRWEGDVRYESGPLLVQAEFIHARDVAKDRADPVDANGTYLAVGYTLKDKSLHGDLQPVLRVGYVDPDTSKDLDGTGSADEVMHYDVGVNYYLKAHEMKLQASYQRQQFDDKPAVNEIIVGAQVAY